MNLPHNNDGKLKVAIALLRVSSDKQFQHGYGTQIQKQAIDVFAEKNGYVIIHYFVEHYSGWKPDRAMINEIIQFAIEHQGEISALLFYDITRFTRGGPEVYHHLQKTLRSLGTDTVDASGIIQKPVNTMAHTGFEYEWSVRSPSRMTETILAEQAHAEHAQILTRCISGQIETAQSGYQYKSADFGYRNERLMFPDGRKRVVAVRDEDEAPYIEMMFRLRAEGNLSDEEICDALNNAGYRSRTFNRYDSVTREVIGRGGGVLLEPKQLNRHIRRTAYCGVRICKWTHWKPEWMPTEIPRLVSVDMFNKANRGTVNITVLGDEILVEENTKAVCKSKDTDSFRLRHVIHCHECNRPMKASRSRGKSGSRFGYYHCSRSHKYFGVNQQVFEETIGKTIRTFRFKKKLLGLLKEIVRDVWIQHHKADEVMRVKTENHLKSIDLQKEQTLLRITRSGSEAVQIALEAEFERLEQERVQTLKQLADLQEEDDRIEDYFDKIKQAVEHPEKWLLGPLSKTSLVSAWNLVFEDPPTWDDFRSGTLRMSLPFRVLSGSETRKGQLVALLSSESNTLIEHIKCRN